MRVEPLQRCGRPDQQASEELVRNIVDTAARLFIEQGYSATSIEQVAAAAGSGKQTIYRRFASKEGLFTEVINRQGQLLLGDVETAEAQFASPLEALRHSCRRVFDFALMPDMIRLHRILVAEVPRFPELGEYVLNRSMASFRARLSRFLIEAMDAGEIRAADVDLTQSIMHSVLTGWPTQQYLLGREPFRTQRERDAYFEAAWNIFLNGAR
jgi:AcrR family transcriptional regulator